MSPPLLRPRAKGPSAFATLVYASSTLLSTGVAAATDSFDVLDYVDPFIGTANGGMTSGDMRNRRDRIWILTLCRTCLRWRNIAIR